MRKWMRTAGLILSVGVIAGGCIDESDGRNPAAGGETAGDAASTSASEPAAHSASVAAVMNEWTITLDPASVDAGTISFEVQNHGSEAHVFEIEGGGEQWRTDPIATHGSATLSVALSPGTYNVYCPLDSGGEAHADRGMKTTFRVQ